MHDYVMADDLSGALEAGAPWKSAGWRVHVPLDPASAAVRVRDPARIDLVSTGTREAPSAEAAATVRCLVQERRGAGAKLVAKKIDSTLRGPVGEELAAVICELAPPLTLFCPANPAVGRTVEDGRLFVGGRPLEQTAFARDPGSPARTGRIATRLAEGGLTDVRVLSRSLWCRAGTDAAEFLKRACADRAIIVPDFSAGDDMGALLADVLRVEPRTLVVGSGACVAALAAAAAVPVPAAPVRGRPFRSVLVLAGTRHPATHRQLDRLAAAGVPVETLTELTSESVAGSAPLMPVRAVRFAPQRVFSAGALLAELERRGRIAAAEGAVDLLYVIGGETVAAVTRALDGIELIVVRDLAPGVVLSRLVRRGSPDLALVTKPGGFGDECDLLKHLALVM